MSGFSYRLSDQLQVALKNINSLRSDLLLSVITPEKEMRLRWQTAIDRIYWSLTFSHTALSKSEIEKLIRTHVRKQPTPAQQEALAYKKGLDYIAQNWLASLEPVSSITVLLLHQIACQGKLKVSQESLKLTLAYFQGSSEHPVIQAGLVHFQILALSPFTNDNEKMSRLLSYLFLYKEGFDCRGLLVTDEYFRRNATDYQQIFKQTLQTGTQTLWLEYFAKAVQSSLEKALEEISKEKSRVIEKNSSTFKLNERQKQILTLLENPDMTIANRQVQHLFKISQITASRDLANLSLLGLLFSHGKGRSVYYTRI